MSHIQHAYVKSHNSTSSAIVQKNWPLNILYTPSMTTAKTTDCLFMSRNTLQKTETQITSFLNSLHLHTS